MDARRFDTLIRTLAHRQSRRAALRQTLATAAAGLLAATGLRATQTAVPARTVTAAAQAGCTSHGCVCIDGPDAACDPDLLCCGTTGIPNGPGICLTEAACHPVCTGVGCYCDVNDVDACDAGLVCCAVQSGYICASVAQCGGGPLACTGEGCTCDWRDASACDPGLVCCLPNSQGEFTCLTEADCGAACTGLGCDCAVHGGACDDGMICCGPDEAGARGTCQFPGDCFGEPPCDGPGCPCDVGSPDDCAPGLFCCGGACTTDPACGAGPACEGDGCLCDINDPRSCAPGLECCLPSSQGDFVCVAAGTCGA